MANKTRYKTENPMSNAYDFLKNYIDNWIEEILCQYRGREKMFLSAIVKIADFESLKLGRHSNIEIGSEEHKVAHHILRGSGLLLWNLQPVCANDQSRSSFCLPNEELLGEARQYLVEAGFLIHAFHLTSAAKYGITQAEILDSSHVRISMCAANVERHEENDRNHILDAEHHQRQSDIDVHLNAIEHWMHTPSDPIKDLMDIKSPTSDSVIRKAVFELLTLWEKEYVEADAFPDNLQIGQLAFAEWKKLAVGIAALNVAQASCYIKLSYQTRTDYFSLPVPTIDREALHQYISELLGSNNVEQLDDVVEFFLTTSDGSHRYMSAHVDLQPLLIPVDDKILAPRYGAAANPYLAMYRKMKEAFVDEWSAFNDRREEQFQKELLGIFSGPEVIVGLPKEIKMSSKNRLTDIDTTLFDITGNCLYLFQLKWLDPLSTDLVQRESQYNSLLASTKWLSRVEGWVNGQSRAELAKALNIEKYTANPEIFEVRYIVLNRSWTRLSGKPKYDGPAAWVSWTRLLRLVSETPGGMRPLHYVWLTARETQVEQFISSGAKEKFQFPNLLVEIIY